MTSKPQVQSEIRNILEHISTHHYKFGLEECAMVEACSHIDMYIMFYNVQVKFTYFSTMFVNLYKN